MKYKELETYTSLRYIKNFKLRYGTIINSEGHLRSFQMELLQRLLKLFYRGDLVPSSSSLVFTVLLYLDGF